MSRNSAAEGIPDPHARAGMAFREDSHFYATKVIPPMRRAYRELGRRPVAAGVIDDVGDVYHLRFEELEAITDDGGALPASVRQLYRPLVQARAAKRRELQGIPLLDTAFLFRNRRSGDCRFCRDRLSADLRCHTFAMKVTGWLSPDEFWDEYGRMEELVRESFGELTCYGLDRWSGPISIGEWDLGSSPSATMSLEYGSGETGPMVRVTTTSEDPRLTVAHRRLILDGPPASGEGLARRLRLLTSARGEEASIPVDGAEKVFETWREAGRWWAAGQHDGKSLVLEGTTELDVSALSLHRVYDIEPYPEGRRAQIRAARGGL
jgi:hypothetical protein